MVDASAQPHIVVTLEPNPWAAFYFDINIANTGNAPAYNVEVVLLLFQMITKLKVFRTQLIMALIHRVAISKGRYN